MELKFQSTPPCGGDPASKLSTRHCRHFNPRPLAGATCIQSVRPAGQLFQSTPPCGGDIRYLGFRSGLLHFNPRPLAGATVVDVVKYAVIRHFNPRPLAGATINGNNISVPIGISIHAPLRGRHALVLGVSGRERFQSTPPCGGDQGAGPGLRKTGISIHAPLRGRQLDMFRTGSGAKFQSTPPCGGDSASQGRGGRIADFNPRPLAGATCCRCFIGKGNAISIHAPLRGRRSWSVLYHTCACISIHAPLRGRPATKYYYPTRNDISIHAPLRGRRIRKTATLYNLAISIHAPLRGRLQLAWMNLVNA